MSCLRYWRAYVEPVAMRNTLTDMPLFLEPGAHVPIRGKLPIRDASEAIAQRWRRVLDV